MKSKFRKSRFVPLHSTTVEKMDTTPNRGNSCSTTACRTFSSFPRKVAISPTVRAGKHLPGSSAAPEFASNPVVDGLGFHALRHSFTVGRMVEWHRAGMPVKDLLPTLSVYLGHVQPAHTYWYLTATPELLSRAADAFLRYAGQGGGDE